MSPACHFYLPLIFLIVLDRLYEVDLAIVKNELWPLRNLWRGIGENLGIRPHDLEEIAEIERRIPGNCFGSMLLKWLRRKSTPDHPITWEGLVTALQVGQLKDECGAVVEKIVRKFDIVQPLLSELIICCLFLTYTHNHTNTPPPPPPPPTHTHTHAPIT